MKKILALWASLALCAFLVAPLAGCNTTPQQATFQAVGTTSVTVETAMGLWGAWVAHGKATVAQEQQVKLAFTKYQAAMATVCDLGAVYAASGTTNAAGATTGLSGALQQAILNSGQTITDLETLIASFGVKLQ